MRAANRDQVVAVVLRILKDYPAVKLCILYGSAGRDRLREHSDVDLAVGAGRRLSSQELGELQTALSEALERSVDLLDLEALTGLLWEFLWSEGVFLLRDRELLVKYTGKAQAFVEDVKPGLMRMIDHRLEKEFGPT